MGSGAPDTETGPRHRGLFSGYMLVAAWLPTIIITVFHYATGSELHWLHDVLRRMYYLPIILAAFSCGLRGGLVVAVSVALAYGPHAFSYLIQIDPAHTLEKVLELVLYLVVGGVVGLLMDRERRRHAQLSATAAQLRSALEEKERASEQLVRAGRLAALGELVAGIAHEIKNPLHSLRGTAEVVDQEVPTDSPRRRMWELHVKELDRLQGVADRFLSFARPTAPASREIDLAHVVARTAELVGAQARQEGVEVLVTPHGDERLTVNADPEQLTQVLLNIALNGVQAMAGDGGTLRLTLFREARGEGSYAVVEVQNDGPTIAEADQERIFDPFVTSKADGVGLGLSVASRIMEQHNGFIRVRNLGPEGGVAFAISVPLTEPEVAST